MSSSHDYETRVTTMKHSNAFRNQKNQRTFRFFQKFFLFHFAIRLQIFILRIEAGWRSASSPAPQRAIQRPSQAFIDNGRSHHFTTLDTQGLVRKQCKLELRNDLYAVIIYPKVIEYRAGRPPDSISGIFLT